MHSRHEHSQRPVRDEVNGGPGNRMTRNEFDELVPDHGANARESDRLREEGREIVNGHERETNWVD